MLNYNKKYYAFSLMVSDVDVLKSNYSVKYHMPNMWQKSVLGLIFKNVRGIFICLLSFTYIMTTCDGENL